MSERVTQAQIQELISCNPRLAYILARSNPLMLPNSYTMPCVFETGAEGDHIEPVLSQSFVKDAWVKSVFYSLERPHYLAGSPFKQQADDYATRNPYVTIETFTEGWDEEVQTQGPQPIQNVFSPAGTSSIKGFMNHKGYVFVRDTTFKARLVLTRTLDVVNGEVPYKINVTFLVMEIKGCSMRGISRLEALLKLKEMNYCVSDECIADCKGR